MNLEKLTFGTALTVTVLAVAGLAACERHSDVPPAPMGASPSAQVIGTVPAPPPGDPPGTIQRSLQPRGRAVAEGGVRRGPEIA